MTHTTLIWAGMKTVGLYYFIQGTLNFLSSFALAVGDGLGSLSPAIWWHSVLTVAVGGYLAADGSLILRVFGSPPPERQNAM